MRHIFHLFLLLLLSLSACKGGRTSSEKPILTVSIEPLRWVVSHIAGEDYEVNTLMPQGASPETYEPTPRQMINLSQSEILFSVGTMGFEQTRLRQMAASSPELHLVELREGITPIAEDGHHHGAVAESIDPHLWMSTQNLCLMARQVARTLSTHQPARRAYYEERLNMTIAKLEELDKQLRSTLLHAPSRTFLIYHPALGYMARQYGLVQLAVEHDGKEPSAASFQQLVNTCRSEEIKVAFVSKEHSGQAARRIAGEVGARIVEINPLAYDITQQMRLIAKSLTQE